MEEGERSKSIGGYKVIIVILAVILGVLSWLYYQQVSQLREEFSIERDTLNSRIESLVRDYDEIQTANDTINRHLDVARGKADSLLTRLQNERSINRRKIKAYEDELGTLRSVMRGFVKQIDSLNRLNTSLISENLAIRRTADDQRARAELAEERAEELGTKIRKGSVIRAREIALTLLTSGNKVASRVANAARLRVDFVLAANELAKPGERNVYVRIVSPDGYIMSVDATTLFSHEGDKISYSAMRQVDYQNQDLPVSIYYNGSGITPGNYRVALYADGYQIGSSETILK
ncbi:MAG: hypothetical protein LBH06_09255 [Rikenellaceae bacterium]|jgi:hypothetical protein|nr:hypothetical protein [Rikenellaceae bacterium]